MLSKSPWSILRRLRTKSSQRPPPIEADHTAGVGGRLEQCMMLDIPSISNISRFKSIHNRWDHLLLV